jgi:hypothetical protein
MLNQAFRDWGNASMGGLTGRPAMGQDRLPAPFIARRPPAANVQARPYLDHISPAGTGGPGSLLSKRISLWRVRREAFIGLVLDATIADLKLRHRTISSSRRIVTSAAR